MKKKILFNIPYINKNSKEFINKVFQNRKFTDGYFQKKCENFIKKKIKSKFVAMTHSCTAALEISALLINLKQNDEVLLPSYGFVSIANALVLRGAKPIFVDIDPNTLNISLDDILKKITKRTKAIYVIHYAGNSCEIDKIKKVAKSKKIYLVEDAAHAFLSKYKKKYLGTIGDIGVFSFHETKNFVSGQGGCISINNSSLIKRVNYILDKGTNRYEFIKNYKKKIISANKKKFYSWVDVGSEYRAPELSCALLYSQLLKHDKIQNVRKKIWFWFKKEIDNLNSKYFNLLKPIKYSTSAYHLIVLIFNNIKRANDFMKFMQNKGIAATFHYVPLHNSKMMKNKNIKKLKVTENIYKRVVRLPIYVDMNKKKFKKNIF